MSRAGGVLLVLAAGALAVVRGVRGRNTSAATLLEAAALAREAEAERASLEERRRIAREMHDVVAHSISVMVVQAGGARRIIGREPARAVEAAAQIERTGREALVEMRRLLGVLNPQERSAERAPQPGLGGLADLVGRAREAGVPVALHEDGEPRPLPAGMDLAAYRIVQEALTNVLQHACAAATDVHLRWGDDALHVEVADRGPGPVAAGAADDSPRARQGHGIIGMHERVRLYGGELQTGRRRGGGFEIKAHLPYPTKEDA